MTPKICGGCGKPGTWACGPCKAERRRLAAIHGASRPADLYPLADLLDREARVQRYRRRALLRLPLFPPRRTV